MKGEDNMKKANEITFNNEDYEIVPPVSSTEE